MSRLSDEMIEVRQEFLDQVGDTMDRDKAEYLLDQGRGMSEIKKIIRGQSLKRKKPKKMNMGGAVRTSKNFKAWERRKRQLGRLGYSDDLIKDIIDIEFGMKSMHKAPGTPLPGKKYNKGGIVRIF